MITRVPSILLLALAVALPSVSAATVSLTAAQDNAIFQDFPDNSNGAGEFLVVGTGFGAFYRQYLLAFDVAAALPAGATIDSAVLTLQFPTPRNWGNFPVSLQRMTTAWGEAGSIGVMGQGFGGAALASDATWASNVHDTSSWRRLRRRCDRHPVCR